MTKHSSHGGSPHSSAPPSPTHGSSSSGGGGRASGFTVEPTALDSMSNKLNSLGQQLTGHSSSVGGAGPGSGAFGVVGQALSGHLSGALSNAQQHIGNIAKAAHGAGSKTKLTAQDLRDNEATNSKLFTSIGGTSRAMRTGGGGGPIRTSGNNGAGRYNPYGGRPTTHGPGGTVAPPPRLPTPPPPPPPAPPAPPLPTTLGGSTPQYGPFLPNRPPGVSPTVPQSAHDHVIGGEYNNNGKVVGGHVLGSDVDPNKYPNTNPARYGYGVAGGPPATTAYPNGVYNINGPAVNFPAYGPPLAKPGMSTMFPPGVPATHVQDMGNQAWNGGQPSGGFGANNKWYGTATVPQYPNWQNPNAPYYGGQTIQIQGYLNPYTGQPSTYHPSSHQ